VVDPYRDAPAPALVCPRCGVGLTLRAVADAKVDECTRCGGVFVPSKVMPRVTDAFDLAPEVIAQFPEGVTVAHPGGPMYVRCPRCKSVMNRRLFAPGAKVIVDECRGHGVWFDEAELRAVAEFVAAGGMERSRRVQAIERLKIKHAHTATGLTDEWTFWSMLLEVLGLR